MEQSGIWTTKFILKFHLKFFRNLKKSNKHFIKWSIKIFPKIIHFLLSYPHDNEPLPTHFTFRCLSVLPHFLRPSVFSFLLSLSHDSFTQESSNEQLRMKWTEQNCLTKHKKSTREWREQLHHEMWIVNCC